MFVQHCNNCEKRQLIFPSQVKAVVGTEAGVELLYTCWCGAEQVHLMADLDEVTVPSRERVAA